MHRKMAVLLRFALVYFGKASRAEADGDKIVSQALDKRAGMYKSHPQMADILYLVFLYFSHHCVCHKKNGSLRHGESVTLRRKWCTELRVRAGDAGS